jgi:hypothetical protein
MGGADDPACVGIAFNGVIAEKSKLAAAIDFPVLLLQAYRRRRSLPSPGATGAHH